MFECLLALKLWYCINEPCFFLDVLPEGGFRTGSGTKLAGFMLAAWSTGWKPALWFLSKSNRKDMRELEDREPDDREC